MKFVAGIVPFLSALSCCRAGVLQFPLKVSPAYNSSAELLMERRNMLLKGISLASKPEGSVSFISMINNLKGDVGRGYYLEILMGVPAQKMNVLVDTGSSNFAVAGAPSSNVATYFNPQRSTTYRSLNLDVSVRYTQGSWLGKLGTDVITITKGLNGTVTVNIATILESEDFFLPGVNWQGILGLAYKGLAKPSSSIDPFFDSLVKQLGIPDVFSLQMCGAGLSLTTERQSSPVEGSLIMGGIEPSLSQGKTWYTPIKEEWYYQVEILKLEVGGQNLNLDCTEYNTDKAIVDSGTTLLRLPENVFFAVVMAIKESSKVEEFADGFWSGSQLACWPQGTKPWSFFPKISIYLRGENATQSFSITILPQLYIQPMADIGALVECYRFGISSSSNGLVLGATVMEGFYVIFDRAQRRVGFAASTCAVVGGSLVSEIAGPFSATDVSSNCFRERKRTEPTLWIVSYALITLCGLTLLISIILLLFPCSQRRANGLTDDSSLIQHRWK
ncbi:beta-secretase 2 isoform X1 [Hypanus sabinus]|uniref:beta-secretase 2 isoform X1 n=1 Tax=Hypanus sabinus TaxID=79690 RepID=UPI0028C4DF3D|nr:beta-secretase 2 isoform X1 [Hypanus sabinus]